MNLLDELLDADSGANGGGLDPSLHDHRSIYHALRCFAFRLVEYTFAPNAYLEVCLDYGRRKRRTLLSRIFTRHPLLVKIYLILESAFLSLHTATLLLTFVLYIQEVVTLVTQTEPATIA